MLDHLGGGERAEPSAGAVVGAAREPGQKSRREQIAGAGRVDDALDRERRHRLSAVGTGHQAPLLAARHHCDIDIGAQRRDRRIEIRGLVKAVQLGLVGEDEIDGAERINCRNSSRQRSTQNASDIVSAHLALAPHARSLPP